MEAYKLNDSKIIWQGFVPDHWKKDKLFRLCEKMGSGGTPTSTNENYYSGSIPWIQSGDLTDSYVSKTKKTITEEALNNSSAKMFSRGTLLVALYGATIGKLGIMKMDAATNQACCALQVSKKFFSKFTYYLMLDMRQLLISEAYGGSQPNISQETLKHQYMFIPNINEQKAIADYLDQACQNIDKTIILKQQQLDKLEAYRKSVIHEAVTKGLDKTVMMKDSRVELFGEIPQAWRMHRIKGIVKTKITDGPHETPQLDESGIPFISAEAIKANKIDFNKKRGFISQELHEIYSKKCKPQKFDIFIIKSGATTGNVAYVDTDLEFNIWSPLALVRCQETLADYKFIYYQLLGDVFRKQVELAWSFGTQENIGMGVLGRIKISLPPLHEQKEIAKYLDDVCGKINKTKEITKNQIKTLTQYRQSLIHECVTGKKRIYQGETH